MDRPPHLDYTVLPPSHTPVAASVGDVVNEANALETFAKSISALTVDEAVAHGVGQEDVEEALRRSANLRRGVGLVEPAKRVEALLKMKK